MSFDTFFTAVFCKYFFQKVASKNGECCISVLEKVAGYPAGLPSTMLWNNIGELSITTARYKEKENCRMYCTMTYIMLPFEMIEKKKGGGYYGT